MFVTHLDYLIWPGVDLVALNFSEETQVVRLSELGQGRILLSTHLDREEDAALTALSLRSYEGASLKSRDE